jgi:hypothetical protein
MPVLVRSRQPRSFQGENRPRLGSWPRR